jgi:hypothetical protein
MGKYLTQLKLFYSLSGQPFLTFWKMFGNKLAPLNSNSQAQYHQALSQEKLVSFDPT